MTNSVTNSEPTVYPDHPRTLGWFGTTALAMGGSNQSLFLIGALFIGQGDIIGQGSAAVPLLVVGLLLSWAAAPGWTELVLMWPNRVGGIAATCGEAFRPYAPVLGNLAGTCYWWGWVPTCGLTAILSASAIHAWYLPGVPVNVMACGLVAFFAVLNLCGIAWVARVVSPIATASAALAFLSGVVPMWSGQVDWQQALTFHLTTPFDGWFGQITALMAGLYLIGFAAPAFEAAACHVGEMREAQKNVPRAMLAAGLMAAVYFIVLPLIWLGTLGAEPMGKDLALVLGPTFAPLLGSAAKAAAIWFMMFNMFHGTVQPLAGASRTLSQLAEDGLLPKVLALRSRTDAPWVAILLTAVMAIFFLLIGDPVWLIAAANFTYLIGICLPSVAVWLLRRDAPEMPRPYRAPRGTIALGLLAACAWAISAVLGFQQFGLPTVLIGLAFAYSGAALYAVRKIMDRRAAGLPGITGSLHIKLTGAMLAVLLLDGAGYLLAVQSVPNTHNVLIAALEDIFVLVAMLTITVGLVLPGMIAHSAAQVSDAATRLARGTVADFTRAMQALGRGNLSDAHARVNVTPIVVHSRDELGDMAANFNTLQAEIGEAAFGLDGARNGLQQARDELQTTNGTLAQRVADLNEALRQREEAEEKLLVAKAAAEQANRAKSQFLANMSHEIRTPLNGVLGMTELLLDSGLDSTQRKYAVGAQHSGEALLGIVNDIQDFSKIEAGKLDVDLLDVNIAELVKEVIDRWQIQARNKNISIRHTVESKVPAAGSVDPLRLRQILNNLIGNAIKFTESGHVTLRVSASSAGKGEAESSTITLSSGTRILKFEVTDSGIGIAEEGLAQLFAPFTQVDASTTRKHGGTGLGLAITKQLVELMGGTVGVSSRVGIGSKFWFTLPVAERDAVETTIGAPAQPGAVATPQRKTGRGSRVLLAEDNGINRAVATTLLRNLGIEVDAVSTGIEVVEALQQTDYDLVLMDCHMPEMDGFEATRRIRESEASRAGASERRARVPIVALTANAMKGDRERCLACGMDDYLAKPFSKEKLQAMMTSWLSEGAA